MATLSDIEIQRALGRLSGWARKGATLIKRVEFPTFTAGIAFLVRVASLAEMLQHHPDIDIRYTRVQFVLTTHDAGGITAKDLELAAAIDALLAS